MTDRSWGPPTDAVMSELRRGGRTGTADRVAIEAIMEFSARVNPEQCSGAGNNWSCSDPGVSYRYTVAQDWHGPEGPGLRPFCLCGYAEYPE